MTLLWDEDAKTYEKQYWQSRKNLGMTEESIKRDVSNLKLWLENHPYLPSSIVGGTIINHFGF